MSISEWIFEQIDQRLSPGAKLVLEVSNTLGKEVNECNRLIQGKALLNAEEMYLLLSRYNISLDHFNTHRGQQQPITGARAPYVSDNETLLTYFSSTYGYLKGLPYCRHQLYYAARDIPLFYYFLSEKLARFKLMVWLRDANYERYRNYGLSDIGDEVARKTTDLMKLYEKIESVELWTDRTTLNQLAQMQTLILESAISSRECLELLQELRKVFVELKERLVMGVNKRIVLAGYLNMTNNALVVSDHGNRCFLSFAGINYVTTSDATLSNDLEYWFKQHVESGLLLNEHEQERNEFFEKIFQQISLFERQLLTG